MNEDKPYVPPQVVVNNLGNVQSKAARITGAKSGRQLILISIVAFVIGTALRVGKIEIEPLALLLGFVALVSAVAGIVRVCRITEVPVGLTALAVIGLLVPVINFFILAYLISRASKVIRSDSGSNE